MPCDFGVTVMDMSMAPYDVRGFLAELGRPAQVASISAKGMPVLGSLWFCYDQGRFWFSSARNSPLPQAVIRSMPVAVIVDDFNPPELIRQVRVRGAGMIERHDASVVNCIYRRYLGQDPGRWPEGFRERAADSDDWVLWSVRPDSGIVVTSPGFAETTLRWHCLEDSPLGA